jgi:hypothetical protein
MPTSSSRHALQLAKLNLSSLSTKTVISYLIEIFRLLDSPSTPFYTPNAVHADFSVETSSATRKTQSFLDFEENSVISFLIEMFRRLDALSTPFCAPNAVHADFIFETSPAAHNTQSFFDFDENCYFVLD